ncbi:MAG TPA: response regulator transcription factor [Rectinemataceae bacterium]|nr:response regulator transcription factor [Rectinemataceae bacterium]
MVAEPRRIPVLVIDDHPSVRKGYKTMIESSGRFAVVGLGASIEEARSLLEELGMEEGKAAILVIDVNLKDQNGLDLIRQLDRVEGSPACVAISMSIRAETIIEALSAGARGYIGKDQDEEAVIRVLEAVARGDLGLEGAVLGVIVDSALRLHSARMGLERSRYDGLTPREKEVFHLIALNRSNEAIASALELSPKTVDNIRSAIYGKIDAHDRLDLYRYALKIGLIEE